MTVVMMVYKIQMKNLLNFTSVLQYKTTHYVTCKLSGNKLFKTS